MTGNIDDFFRKHKPEQRGGILGESNITLTHVFQPDRWRIVATTRRRCVVAKPLKSVADQFGKERLFIGKMIISRLAR